MIHGHGNDAYKYDKVIKADFSSNVWFVGPSSELIQYLKDRVETVNRYPEPDCGSLKKKIAEFHGVKANSCLVANGSVEAFYLVALAYQSAKSVIATPCFSEYEDACSIHNHTTEFVSNSKDWEKQNFGNALVWFGNPNNPDGKVISPKVLERMLENNPEATFVVDEAYGSLCAGFQSAVPLIHRFSNLLIVRSFTKNFAIPGLRLGYILGSPSLIDRLNSLKMPWTVNSLALEAGLYIMDHYQQLMPDKTKVERSSKAFQSQLKELENMLTVIPSDCNYCLVKLNGPYAGKLKQYLVDEHGILIRDASNFRGLDEHYIRLALQSPEHNELLVRGLKEGLGRLGNG